MDDELKTKQQRLADFCQKHKLDGVYLHRRNNFSWITAGRDNHIANNSPGGVAGIIAFADGKRVCFANTIEGPRFAEEELTGTGIEVVRYLWHEPAAATKAFKDVIGGKSFAADPNDSGDFNHFGAGLKKLPDEFNELRWSLTAAEIDRYRAGGKRAAAAIEKACLQIKPGMTEHEIAGLLDNEVHAAGSNPVVTLIAADERVRKFRHPIPTNHKLKDYVMLVTCAEFGGLISNLTRFVSFKPLSDEIKKKQQSVCNVDATINHATAPGKTLGELFGVVAKAYAAEGFPKEEDLHHQGGSTGYNGRDEFAIPSSKVLVKPSQAFAWNPSITGTKCEDTIVCHESGKIEVLTAHSSDWPSIEGRTPDGKTLRRAAIRVLG
jgi:Xaa-Pro aminopeptidase